MMTTAAAEYDDAKHMYAYRYRCTSDRQSRVQRVFFSSFFVSSLYRRIWLQQCVRVQIVKSHNKN